jgi:DNA-binding NarL/FixJ family response regulator
VTPVLLVDDADECSVGVRDMFDAAEDFEVVGVATSVAEALAMTEAQGPDVVIMDIRPQDRGGLDASRELREHYPQLRIAVLTTYAGESSTPAPRLSPREQQVLDLIADGMSVAQIAKTLYISESTAKTHISKLYLKLGAGNRAQAIMQAIRAGLLSTQPVDRVPSRRNAAG